MKKVLKQIVGIDVAQDELVVCLSRLYVVLSSGDVITDLYAHKSVPNNKKGFSSLINWVEEYRSAIECALCDGGYGRLPRKAGLLS